MNWAEHEAQWAKRDARREAYEAELAEQERRRRATHVATVYEALKSRDRYAAWGDLYEHAEIAVDALSAYGVVFATIGSWDDEGEETA